LMQKNRALERALKCSVPASLYETLAEALK
jgi:hypothetical protein